MSREKAYSVLVGIAMLIATSAVASARAMTIAERGKAPQRTIVIRDAASTEEELSATELQRYVFSLTGVRLEIAGDGSCPWKFWHRRATGDVIRLVVAPERRDLGGEGFAIRAVGDDLEIVGASSRGVLYGVYRLLERFGGCGWYTSWHEVVPRLERFMVPDDLDLVECPAFRLRELSWFDVGQHPEFALRNCCGESDVYRFDPVLGRCHTFASLLSPDELFESHPEYFSEVDGRRRKTYTQLCLTNPEVVRLCTEKVLERIRDSYGDGVRYYGVSQNDWSGWCTCPNCRAVDEREGSHSGTLVAFVNAIAEAVEREYPDVFIETLVYTHTRRPPRTLRFRKNVIPCLCTIECDFSKPIATSRADENMAVREAIREWGWKSSQLMVWDYTTDFFHYLLAWPNALSLAPNLRLFLDAGATMVLEQGNGGGAHGDWAELKAWLLMKLMWNPHEDVNSLLDRYFSAVYGPAAAEMREYFELVHTRARDEAKLPMRCFDLPERCTLSRRTLNRAAGLVQLAAAKTSSAGFEAYATNVACTRLSLDYTRAIKGYGRFRLRKDASDVDRYEFLAQREGARRILAAKDVVLSQGNDPLAGVFLERLAAAEVPNGPSKRLFVDARSFWRGGIGDSAAEFAEDPDSTAGVALRIKNTTFGRVGYFNFGMVDFEPDAKVRLRMRVKVEKNGRQGEAFSAGVWSLRANRRAMESVSCRTDSLADGVYEWHDLGEWVPGEREFFWIAPGMFNDGECCGSYEGVWLDGLELTLL